MESSGLREALKRQRSHHDQPIGSSSVIGYNPGGDGRTSGSRSETVLSLVASAERGSEHPLAKVGSSGWVGACVRAWGSWGLDGWIKNI